MLQLTTIEVFLMKWSFVFCMCLQSSYPLWEEMVTRAAKLHAALRYIRCAHSCSIRCIVLL